MDTTKENILMCEQAVEVQELNFENKYSDSFSWYAYALNESCEGHFPRNFIEKYMELTGVKSRTWLPRTDQLQALSKLSWQEFDRECLKYNTLTKEQAGLMVVMRQFNKKWNGKNWVAK